MTKIIVIRIRGIAKTPKKIEETLYLLRLRKKFVAVLLEKNKENLGMIKKVKDYVAYGEIYKETIKKLILKRGKKVGEKPLEIAGKTIDEFVLRFIENKSKLKDIKIKPFFRLNPPKGGFKKSTRLSYPKGILGYQGKAINFLVEKML